MAAKSDTLTAGKIAKELGASPAVVKKAISTLKIKPDHVRCGCSYYAKSSVTKIKKSLKK
jgi:hypothetical protein